MRHLRQKLQHQSSYEEAQRSRPLETQGDGKIFKTSVDSITGLKNVFFLYIYFLQHLCELCGQSFANKHYVKTHKDAVHYKLRYKCDDCGKAFAGKVNLKAHRYQLILHFNPWSIGLGLHLCMFHFSLNSGIMSTT